MPLGKKKKKQTRSSDVDIPITPMLDMAFQLLTFFILTYTPSPQETSFEGSGLARLSGELSNDAVQIMRLPLGTSLGSLSMYQSCQLKS